MTARGCAVEETIDGLVVEFAISGFRTKEPVLALWSPLLARVAGRVLERSGWRAMPWPLDATAEAGRSISAVAVFCGDELVLRNVGKRALTIAAAAARPVSQEWARLVPRDGTVKALLVTTEQPDGPDFRARLRRVPNGTTGYVARVLLANP